MSQHTSRRGENRLLALFPFEELEFLRPHMEQVSLSHGDPIIEPDEPIPDVYFPLNCLLSMVTMMEDGSTVESSAIGREGMSGLPVVLDAGRTPMQTLTQIPGDAIRINAASMKEAFDRSAALQRLIHRYIHTVMVTGSQSAACNRLHLIEQRLSRWLLMSSDGIGSAEIALTHEYLAAMLGVRRAGVTEAARKLQALGLISYWRGNIQIIDRQDLEAAACECYAMVKAEFERLLSFESKSSRV